jgi:hypothetical protein
MAEPFPSIKGSVLYPSPEPLKNGSVRKKLVSIHHKTTHSFAYCDGKLLLNMLYQHFDHSKKITSIIRFVKPKQTFMNN